MLTSKRSRVIASDDEIEEAALLSMYIFPLYSYSDFNYNIIASVSNAPHVNELLDCEHSEPEASSVLSKDKTKDVDAFFHPAERIGGKPRRACMLCK